MVQRVCLSTFGSFQSFFYTYFYFYHLTLASPTLSLTATVFAAFPTPFISRILTQRYPKLLSFLLFHAYEAMHGGLRLLSKLTRAARRKHES